MRDPPAIFHCVLHQGGWHLKNWADMKERKRSSFWYCTSRQKPHSFKNHLLTRFSALKTYQLLWANHKKMSSSFHEKLLPSPHSLTLSLCVKGKHVMCCLLPDAWCLRLSLCLPPKSWFIFLFVVRLLMLMMKRRRRIEISRAWSGTRLLSVTVFDKIFHMLLLL